MKVKSTVGRRNYHFENGDLLLPEKSDKKRKTHTGSQKSNAHSKEWTCCKLYPLRGAVVNNMTCKDLFNNKSMQVV